MPVFSYIRLLNHDAMIFDSEGAAKRSLNTQGMSDTASARAGQGWLLSRDGEIAARIAGTVSAGGEPVAKSVTPDDLELAKAEGIDHWTDRDLHAYLGDVAKAMDGESDEQRGERLAKSAEEIKGLVPMAVEIAGEAVGRAWFSKEGLADLEKARKVPIGTVSGGRKKVAEGKWEHVKQEHKENKVKENETNDKLRDELIDLIRYHKDGIPPKNDKYSLRYKGKVYTSNDTYDLVQHVMDQMKNSSK